MANVLGLDLGTASIGYSLRDTDKGANITEQLVRFGSIIFQKGVGNSKTGEFSYAAERTKHRSSRRLYQARKYRIWETLAVLIEFGFCPLSNEDLDKWRIYDKAKKLKRQYPIDAIKFEQWVRLDFDGDGKPDYLSPYQLREELAIVQLDFSQEINRFKLGRALYHIAQRRGFKSSKGETLKEQEDAVKDNAVDEINLESVSLKKSEEKKSKDLTTYMEENALYTVGCAFSQLEREGIRVRASKYQAVRSQYKAEIKYIFEFQNGLDINGDFYKRIYSDRKSGCIFYKRPLRSQKGLVGKCTLEPAKPRCPVSHPEFEKFRAFAFINNIQYRRTIDEEWQNLTIEQKLKLYNEKFLQIKASFKFEVIRKWIEKEIGMLQDCHMSKEKKTINYSDRTNVSGCPVSGRLKSLFGEEWEEYKYQSDKIRKDKKGKEHIVSYSIEDIWHVCFSYDDEEVVAEFAKSLGLDDKQVRQFLNLWIAIPQGYSMLSIKAIRNINNFLVPKKGNPLYKGYIYIEAALLAKIPEIAGQRLWEDNEKSILESINGWVSRNREEKRILNIVNNLISAYKSLEYNEQFAYKNVEYQLDDSDKKEIEKYVIEAFGEKSWEKETQEAKGKVLKDVENLYQRFFSTSKRDYFHLPKLGDTIKLYLSNNFPDLYCANGFVEPQTGLQCHCAACKKLGKLYHPSMVEFYKPVDEQEFEYNGVMLSKKLLGSPVIGAFKNPMAMRTLHQLRNLINYFIKEGLVEEDTRIVVETARDLNDVNMRWAIEEYQREREKENKAIIEAIKGLKGEEKSDDDIEKARLLIEQNPEYLFDKKRYEVETEDDTNNKKKKKIIGKTKDFLYKKDVTKYRLWLEQGMQCIYTGKTISISELFDENKTDFEHTIPRSKSFDDSLANLTVCDAYYNRHIKKNKIPTELPGYKEEIEPRLQPWRNKIEQLRNNVEFWKQKSKQAQTKDLKDKAIRQKHLWQMELDYWQDKLSRFTMTEVTDGFKHSQLNDTRLITKYAYHYLKSVFSKVEVQKGLVTANFRKILGVQSVDEKKSRDKHSHHAIDATILSLIPVAAKRDRMLELFYKKQEDKKLGLNIEYLENELQREVRSCRIGNISSLSDYIEENILINHISKDQTLVPAKRKMRKRGKVVWQRDENGQICVDKDGNKIPKHWIKGDCIRGKLHGDSFYGAIKQSKKKDEKDYLTSYKDISYVIRRELKYKKTPTDNGFKDLDDLHISIVDEHLFHIIKRQCDGKSFKEACDEGFYMLNRDGDKVNKIRHIRCYTSMQNPLTVKPQSYLSDKEYKQYYYAEMGDLYAMCKYSNADKTKVRYEVISLFDISENRKYGYDIAEVLEDDKKKEKYYLEAILQAGKQVILYKDSNELAGIMEMSNDKLSDRLYVILGFENPSRIKLKKHICAKPDSELGKGESIKSFDALPEKIRQGINVTNCLLEDIDFYISPDGLITFKNRL
ncbi:type II CRISPR RNA-guided endonuclease Cas9 [Bacteroides sp. GD17]|jgi:CRISPR-associated endonuclease Csn1|uniref:type II CRISPR RNA-guided endonuclease Cas9 n=1 Tax=Bacteroides sp. GD17 TaxID=3139826 RepID=UPI00313DDF12